MDVGRILEWMLIWSVVICDGAGASRDRLLRDDVIDAPLQSDRNRINRSLLPLPTPERVGGRGWGVGGRRVT